MIPWYAYLLVSGVGLVLIAFCTMIERIDRRVIELVEGAPAAPNHPVNLVGKFWLPEVEDAGWKLEDGARRSFRYYLDEMRIQLDSDGELWMGDDRVVYCGEPAVHEGRRLYQALMAQRREAIESEAVKKLDRLQGL